MVQRRCRRRYGDLATGYGLRRLERSASIGFLPSKGKRVGANEWSAWCVRRLATRLRTNLVYWRKGLRFNLPQPGVSIIRAAPQSRAQGKQTMKAEVTRRQFWFRPAEMRLALWDVRCVRVLTKRRASEAMSARRDCGRARALRVSPGRTGPSPAQCRDALSDGRDPAHGFEATREAAMQAFARSWHRETSTRNTCSRSALLPRRGGPRQTVQEADKLRPASAGLFLWGHPPDIFRDEFKGGRVVLPPALLP